MLKDSKEVRQKDCPPSPFKAAVSVALGDVKLREDNDCIVEKGTPLLSPELKYGVLRGELINRLVFVSIAMHSAIFSSV